MGTGSVINFFRSLSDEETGQATVEYILLLSVIITGAIAIVRSLMKLMDRGVLNLGSQLEKDLKTGRVPVNVWKDN